MRKNRILQVKATDENAIALVSLVQAKLMLKRYEDKGLVNLDSIKNELSSEDLTYCLDNQIELLRVPFYIELAPSKKTNVVPDMFPNRKINLYNEDGEVTGQRTLKIGEYFRYWELQGRFFIELVKDPKNDPKKEIGTISVVDYLSVSQIQEVLDTFTTAILNSYTEKEFKAQKELLTDEEVA